LHEVPAYLRNEGLDAFEYQAVRWGPKPQVTEEMAKRFGREAKRLDVRLSMHGSYFINLSGEEAVVKASEERLKACMEACAWMGCEGVVFHPGYYGRRSLREALELCKASLRRLEEHVGTLSARLYLRPETTGRVSQVGSVEEVLELCSGTDFVRPAIDWAHIHARGGGALRTRGDYERVIRSVERVLGEEGLRDLHFHFSHIRFGTKGEIEHKNLEEPFGPDFGLLAEMVLELGLSAVIICESPKLDLDAVVMRRVLEELGTRR